MSLPGCPAALRLRASSQAKRATCRVFFSVMTLTAYLPRSRGVEVGAQDSAMEMQRCQRFERPLEPEIEILEILPHDHVVDALRLRERTLEAAHVAARPYVGESLFAPAQIIDRGGLAGGRTEQRRIRGVDRGARGFVGLAAHPMFSGREFDELDFRAERPNYLERGIDRLRRLIVARQNHYFLLRHFEPSSTQTRSNTADDITSIPAATGRSRA